MRFSIRFACLLALACLAYSDPAPSFADIYKSIESSNPGVRFSIAFLLHYDIHFNQAVLGEIGSKHIDIVAKFTTAMYDAYAYINNSPSRITAAVPRDEGLARSIPMDDFIMYVGFAAVRSALVDMEAPLDEFEAQVSDYLGIGDPTIRELVADPIADAINRLVDAHDPDAIEESNPFVAQNPMVETVPDCENLVYPLLYQPFCTDHKVPGAKQNNCDHIIPDDAYESALPIVKRIYEHLFAQSAPYDAMKDFPPPEEFPGYETRFMDLYELTKKLGDEEKVIAEVSDSLAVLHGLKLAIYEFAERPEVPLRIVLRTLMGMGIVARDANTYGRKLKGMYGVARPTSVVPCMLSGTLAEGWRGPYMGSGTLLVDGVPDGIAWQSFRKDFVPAFPSCDIAALAGSVAVLSEELTRWEGNATIRGPRCYTREEGMLDEEPKIVDGRKYIAGVTDVPNKGLDTVGYSPATDVTFCWDSIDDFLNLIAVGRQLGGIDTEVDTGAGIMLGKRAKEDVINLLDSIGA